MYERTFTRNLFLSLFSDSCSDLEKDEIIQLSTSVALEFVSKMKKIDQHEYSYFHPFQTISFTQDENIFQYSLTNLSLKETRTVSAERIIQFLSIIKSLNLGHSYYFWIFSDIPQDHLIELLKPLSLYKAQFFIIRPKEFSESKFLHGVHFFQTSSSLKFAEKVVMLVQLIGESFFIPYSILIRVGQLEQFTWMSVSPNYCHNIDVLDIIGFSPLEDLTINGLISEHVLINYDETDDDSSITSALKTNLQQSSLYAIVQCGVIGRFALIIPSSTSLVLLLLDYETFLLDPWTTELSVSRKKSCDKNSSFWMDGDIDPVLGNHPSTVINTIFKSLINLPENLPELIERLEYVWKNDVVCLSDSKKISIRSSLLNSQRICKTKKDEILNLRFKLALKILNQIKTVSEFYLSSKSKSIDKREHKITCSTNNGSTDLSALLKCSDTVVEPNQLYQSSVYLNDIKSNYSFGAQPCDRNQDHVENDALNPEKWFFCESIDSLISSSKSNTKKSVSDFSHTGYSLKNHDINRFYEKESCSNLKDLQYSTEAFISNPGEGILSHTKEFLNCLSVPHKHNDSVNDEYKENQNSLSFKKPLGQRKSTPEKDLIFTGKSDSLKNSNLKESYHIQDAERSTDVKNKQILFLLDDNTCKKNTTSSTKVTPSYCLAPGLTSYLRIKYEAINRTPNNSSNGMTEPPNEKTRLSSHPSSVSNSVCLSSVSDINEFKSPEENNNPKKMCLNTKNGENSVNPSHFPNIDSNIIYSETVKNDPMKLPGSQNLGASRCDSLEFYKNLNANFYHIDYTDIPLNDHISFSTKEKSAKILDNTQDDCALLFDTKNILVPKNKAYIVSMETIPDSTTLQANNTISQNMVPLKRSLESTSLDSELNSKKPNTSFSHFSEDKSIITCQSPEMASSYQEFSESNLSSTDSYDNFKNSSRFLSFSNRHNPNKNMVYGYHNPRERYFQKDGSIGTNKKYHFQPNHKYRYNYTRDYEKFDFNSKFTSANLSNIKEYSERDRSLGNSKKGPVKRYPDSFDETRSFQNISKKDQDSAYTSSIYDYRGRPHPHLIKSIDKEYHSYTPHSNGFRNNYSDSK